MKSRTRRERDPLFSIIRGIVKPLRQEVKRNGDKTAGKSKVTSATEAE